MLTTEWQTSTFSAGGQCVEVHRTGLNEGLVELRHSKGLPDPVFTLDEWNAFIAGVKAGEFDIE